MCTLCSVNPVSAIDGGHRLLSDSHSFLSTSNALGSVPVEFNYASGDQNIDALMWDLKWSDLTLTYSFPDQITDYDQFDQSLHGQDFLPFTDTQRAATVSWLDMVASVSGLSFIESTGANDSDAVLKFSNGALFDPATESPITAFAYFPTSQNWGGDVWFGFAGWLPDHDQDYQYIGSYDYHTIGHELGHALGLTHGHESSNPYGAMTSAYDAMEYTIMTYRSYQNDPLQNGYSNAEGSFAQSLMMYDIAALQQMYGATYDYNRFSSTYTWDEVSGAFYIDGVEQFDGMGDTIFHTIWDGGGWVDHYDLSNFTSDVLLDLRPGYYSDFDLDSNQYAADLGDGNYASGQVYNALMYEDDTWSLIEKGTGGSGNDVIIGNVLNNQIDGQDGDDTIYGYDGFDRLVGSAGNDVIYGGASRDTIIGAADDDIIYGEQGFDLLYGWAGNDTIFGGDNADTILGDVGEDILFGEQGSDLIDGGADNDVLIGGNGHDTLDGGKQNDIMFGGAGNDIMTGGWGADEFIFNDTSLTQVDTITDFGYWIDTLVIYNVTFDDITISAIDANSSQIEVGSTVILVTGLAADQWQEDYFDFRTGSYDPPTIGEVSAVPAEDYTFEV